jgi:hypothetical protein
MDDHGHAALANRDEPIPVVDLPGSDGPSDDGEGKGEGKRDRLKRSLQKKLQDVVPKPSSSIQDQLLAKYVR